jgi:hypothetical protein
MTLSGICSSSVCMLMPVWAPVCLSLSLCLSVSVLVRGTGALLAQVGGWTDDVIGRAL